MKSYISSIFVIQELQDPGFKDLNVLESLSAMIYLFKVNNRDTIKRCEICSKFTIKTSDRHHQRRSGVFIVNFEHVSHLFLVFLLLNLRKLLLGYHFSIAVFGQ